MRGIGEGCLLTCIYSRLRPVCEHVPHDVVVDADEQLHDGIGRRELAALREREEVEQFLERRTDVLLVGTCSDDALVLRVQPRLHGLPVSSSDGVADVPFWRHG